MRVQKGTNGSEHVCTLPRFIIDGDEAGKWLRNKLEMKEGVGVVILKQEKCVCARFLFALHFVPVPEVMDEHLSRHVVLPECLAEEGNREQSVTMH